MTCPWCDHEHPNGIPAELVEAGHPYMSAARRGRAPFAWKDRDGREYETEELIPGPKQLADQLETGASMSKP